MLLYLECIPGNLILELLYWNIVLVVTQREQCCQIGRVNIGLGGGTKFGLVWGQFGGFKTSTFYRLIS